MSLVGGIWEERAVDTGKIANPPKWLAEFFGGGSLTASGIRVDAETALHNTGFLACVNLLADMLASLPLPVYRRLQPRGKTRVIDHWLYKLLHDEPNPEQSSFVWRQTLQAHLCLWNNAYAEIERDQGRRIKALWPLPPNKVRLVREGPRAPITYWVERTKTGEQVPLEADQVFHLPGLKTVGLGSLSRVDLAKESIGLGLAAEEFAARLFSGDMRPSMVYEIPGELSDKAFARLTEWRQESRRGLSKAHRSELLEEGMKAHEVGIPPEAAQMIESRQFQKNDMATLYRIPPHLIGVVDRSTSWGTGIEQQNIGFVVYTLRPWLVLWEQEIHRQLLPTAERGSLFAEFVVEGLLRGDFKSQMEGFRIGREIGIYNADDILEIQNRNPLPDDAGQKYYVPLNWQEVGAKPAADGASSRDRIARAFRGVFADAFGRIIRRERADVMRAAEKMLPGQSADFERWVESFYDEHAEFVQRQAAPAFSSFAEAIVADTEASVETVGLMTPQLEGFISGYIGEFDRRWVETSRAEVIAVARDACTDGGDAIAALQERFDAWPALRAEQAAGAEAVAAAEAVARAALETEGLRGATAS